jgi:hypothetical protein
VLEEQDFSLIKYIGYVFSRPAFFRLPAVRIAGWLSFYLLRIKGDYDFIVPGTPDMNRAGKVLPMLIDGLLLGIRQCINMVEVFFSLSF